MLQTFKWALVALTALVFSNQTFAGSLIINTGWNYGTNNIYANGQQDNYWIRIASGPAQVTTTPGLPWSITIPNFNQLPPYNGIFPSTWISGFGSNAASPSGASWITPAYSLFRKCFCMPQGAVEPRIIGKVLNDDSIQLWLNLMSNQLLTPNVRPLNNNPPNAYTLNSNATFFRTGINCLYALVEDTGGLTGFNLSGEIATAGPSPYIAEGITMSFSPCSCQTPRGLNPQIKFDVEEKAMIKEIVKNQELKRLELQKQNASQILKQ